MRDIHVQSLVFHKNAVVIEVPSLAADYPDFWIEITPSLGFLKFEQVKESQGAYQSTELLLGSSPVPSPLVSVPHVLWHRQAALEAYQGIYVSQPATSRFSES